MVGIQAPTKGHSADGVDCGITPPQARSEQRPGRVLGCRFTHCSQEATQQSPRTAATWGATIGQTEPQGELGIGFQTKEKGSKPPTTYVLEAGKQLTTSITEHPSKNEIHAHPLSRVPAPVEFCQKKQTVTQHNECKPHMYACSPQVYYGRCHAAGDSTNKPLMCCTYHGSTCAKLPPNSMLSTACSGHTHHHQKTAQHANYCKGPVACTTGCGD